MREAEHARVQREARRPRHERARQLTAVRAIAGDRVTDACEVDADLMLAPRLEARRDERGTGERLDRRDVRDRAPLVDRTIDRLRDDLADRDRVVLALDV